HNLVHSHTINVPSAKLGVSCSKDSYIIRLIANFQNKVLHLIRCHSIIPCKSPNKNIIIDVRIDRWVNAYSMDVDGEPFLNEPSFHNYSHFLGVATIG